MYIELDMVLAFSLVGFLNVFPAVFGYSSFLLCNLNNIHFIDNIRFIVSPNEYLSRNRMKLISCFYAAAVPLLFVTGDARFSCICSI